MARIVLLGTGTGVPGADRENTHLVFDPGTAGGAVLVDAGGSTYQRLLRAGLDPQTLGAVVLTHTHPDHLNGLPVLLFSLYLAGRREEAEPLPIYGLPSTLDRVRIVLDAFDLERYVTPVDWRAVEAGDDIALPAPGWTLRTAPTLHSRPCIALRWDERGVDGAPGVSLTYSCDTSPCPAVDELARGTNILIHEATTPGPFASHTSPRQAGEVAARANAKRLVLVHFSPQWTMPEADALAQVRAGGFEGAAEIGHDGQSVSLRDGAALFGKTPPEWVQQQT